MNRFGPISKQSAMHYKLIALLLLAGAGLFPTTKAHATGPGEGAYIVYLGGAALIIGGGSAAVAGVVQLAVDSSNEVHYKNQEWRSDFSSTWAGSFIGTLTGVGLASSMNDSNFLLPAMGGGAFVGAVAGYVSGFSSGPIKENQSSVSYDFGMKHVKVGETVGSVQNRKNLYAGEWQASVTTW